MKKNDEELKEHNTNKTQEYENHARRIFKVTWEWTKFYVVPRIRRIFNPTFWTVSATVAIAAATIAYTHYAQKQWQVMSSQLNLTRDQLKGTQAAFIFMNVAMDQPYGAVNVYAKNTGHVIASNFTARFAIARKTLPERKTIGEPIIKTIGPHTLEVGQDGMIGETYKIPDFGSEGWDSIKRLEQTVFVEWDISYNNGFEEVVNDHRCMFYLYSNFQVRDGQVVGFPVGFTPCGSFERMFEDATNSKKTAESEANTKKTPKKPN